MEKSFKTIHIKPLISKETYGLLYDDDLSKGFWDQ